MTEELAREYANWDDLRNRAYEKQDFDKAMYCYGRMDSITALVKRGFVPPQEFKAAVEARGAKVQV